ncbi:VanZ family protein [Nocardioides sp.]|uniref:VanZ family protein n=1 Tax=Nocardioides sp. TaxID=35761 RepID=UPI0027359121|nr:VanZ family protein [Nocardioides sp.]MDP3894438.1 VanZ family protein [Nocardioides sp.]
MVDFSGTEVMVLGAVVSGVGFLLLAAVLQRWLGWVPALAWCGFVWSLVVIALVTMVPTYDVSGGVSLESRPTSCSWDIGGPAPEGFWIFDGAQRTLNTALFVPSGALLVVAVARGRSGFLLAPLGLGALAAYSVAIEYTQLELARIDRACDITDVIDNVTGAVIGFGIGLVLLAVLRPWRSRRRV